MIDSNTVESARPDLDDLGVREQLVQVRHVDLPDDAQVVLQRRIHSVSRAVTGNVSLLLINLLLVVEATGKVR